ncbi:MAG: hypothetical protein QGH74_07510, partial [Candidatus Brocadiia bacterium]|nr:hypothetical protein [Candidatus Brocadiia bacterium]
MRARDRAASVLYMRPGRRPEDRHSYQRILNSFGLFRHVFVDCCPQPEEILRVLRRYRPDALGGYPGALSRIAEATTERDRREISPGILAAGGEVLTGAMREQIRRGFQAPVYNLYGSNELPLIAWECKETGELHTCDDGVIVEVLKNGRPAGPGEQGELVGTNLHSFAMPFIRYRQGDVVTRGAGRCACGQPFSTMRAIEGRTIDYFTLPDGRLMHPYQAVYAVLDAAPWL